MNNSGHHPKTHHPVELSIASAWPQEDWEDLTVLVAVSGGADSVALLRALVSVKCGGQGRLIAAHLNHRLRGEASEADESFVTDLCRQLGICCEVERLVAGHLADARDGLETAARHARYAFLRRTAERMGARYVATAHTADDQAETILHRIVRGTGIAGLGGMARARPLSPACTLIRPLLSVRRVELAAYLSDLGQPYRLDASNEDRRFTRNRIRHELLPALADHYNPGVVDALLRLGAVAQGAQEVIDSLVDALTRQCVAVKPSGTIQIALAPLAGQSRYLVRELLIATWKRSGWPLQSMGFVEWETLAEMTVRGDRAPGADTKREFPGGVLAEVGEGALFLRRLAGPANCGRSRLS